MYGKQNFQLLVLSFRSTFLLSFSRFFALNLTPVMEKRLQLDEKGPCEELNFLRSTFHFKYINHREKFNLKDQTTAYQFYSFTTLRQPRPSTICCWNISQLLGAPCLPVDISTRHADDLAIFVICFCTLRRKKSQSTFLFLTSMWRNINHALITVSKLSFAATAHFSPFIYINRSLAFCLSELSFSPGWKILNLSLRRQRILHCFTKHSLPPPDKRHFEIELFSSSKITFPSSN